MENASKALIMVGGVLLAILVISAGVYLVGNLSKTADSYTTKLDTTELQKYNSKFEIYIGRSNITAQEIVTVINSANQFGYGTRVYVNGADYTDKTEEEKTRFLSENILTYVADEQGNMVIKNSFSYVIDSITYFDNGKVAKIEFKKN